MKTLQISMPLLVTIFIASCSNDDSSNNNQQTLLTKSITSSQTTTYVYDDNNRPISFDVVFTNPISNYSATYTYNSSGQISEMVYDTEANEEDIKSIYFYNNSGQITKIETYLVTDGTPTLASKSDAIYTTPGKVSVYETLSGELPFLKDEYYLDANGNISEQLAYDASGLLLSTTENSDFDSNPTASQSLPKTGFARSVNNYGMVTVTPIVGEPSTGTFTYEYNSDGYPTKRTSNTGSIITYEYIKR